MPSFARTSFDQKLADLDHELMLAAAMVAQSVGAVTEADFGQTAHQRVRREGAGQTPDFWPLASDRHEP